MCIFCFKQLYLILSDNISQVLAAALTCNVILIVLDALKPMTHKLIIEKELHGFGIRLNQSPPEIVFKFSLAIITANTLVYVVVTITPMLYYIM